MRFIRVDPKGHSLDHIKSVLEASTKTLAGNFSETADYLAIKPISKEIALKYELGHSITNLSGFNFSPDICKYIYCAQGIFNLTDLISEFPRLGDFAQDLPFGNPNLTFPPSPRRPAANGPCDQCFGGDIRIIDPGDLIDVTIPIDQETDVCGPTDLTEYEILKLLHDINPRNTLSWDLSDKTMHSWDGVILINGKIRSLSLREVNLDSLPMELGYLCDLISLEVYGNKI